MLYQVCSACPGMSVWSAVRGRDKGRLSKRLSLDILATQHQQLDTNACLPFSESLQPSQGVFIRHTMVFNFFSLKMFYYVVKWSSCWGTKALQLKEACFVDACRLRPRSTPLSLPHSYSMQIQGSELTTEASEWTSVKVCVNSFSSMLTLHEALPNAAGVEGQDWPQVGRRIAFPNSEDACSSL